MKILIRKSRKLKRFQVFSALVVLMLIGCKPTERIINHTEYVNKIQLDSVYFSKRDSIYVEKKGDTIRISKFQTIYKDRIHIQKDTVNNTDTIRVQTFLNSKETSEKGSGFILVIVLAAFAVFKLVTWSPIQSIIKKLLKIN